MNGNYAANQPRMCATCGNRRIVWWTPLVKKPGRAEACPHCADWPVVESVAGLYAQLAKSEVNDADGWLDWSWRGLADEVRQWVGGYKQLSIFDLTKKDGNDE